MQLGCVSLAVGLASLLLHHDLAHGVMPCNPLWWLAAWILLPQCFTLVPQLPVQAIVEPRDASSWLVWVVNERYVSLFGHSVSPYLSFGGFAGRRCHRRPT